MNDKASTENIKPAFDPARDGWEPAQSAAFGTLVGPIWRKQVGERLRFGFIVAAKHMNRAGNVHGGMLMSLADQSMAMASRPANGGKRQATMELNIQFIGPAHLGEFVEAHPAVVRVTRSVVFMEAKMFVGERIVASANGIWKTFGNT
jgi:uncharacterized protein (TIGR00369 family)